MIKFLIRNINPTIIQLLVRIQYKMTIINTIMISKIRIVVHHIIFGESKSSVVSVLQTVRIIKNFRIQVHQVL